MNRMFKMQYVCVLCAVFVAVTLLPVSLQAQTGLYVPSAKPVKNMQKALTNPETFYLLLTYNGNAATYTESDLDWLDSAYGIAFDMENPMYYTMVIEGYGDADSVLCANRVDMIYRYFANRSHADFPIRYARNPIHCSCNGDTVETLRFEVPTATAVYNCSELPESRLLLNGSVALNNSVLITFHNNPDECVGSARGCFVPGEDSLVRGYYASVLMAKGSVYAVDNTKDTCPGGLKISIDDHLDYKQIVERYYLIPHPKQLLVQAGYIVLGSNMARTIDECRLQQKDSIFIRIPATEEQLEAKLKFFAKVKSSRGMEYKALPTRKVPGKGALELQAPINITMMDTIYVGKRIQEKELKKYFYEVETSTEAASFTVGKRHYVAYRPGRNGEYEMKKPLQALFRIVPDQEEDLTPETKTDDPEEIIE